MGFFSRLIDRIDSKIDKPADQSVLDGRRNPGSETMLGQDSADGGSGAARRVRRDRSRRRHRWGGGL